MATNTNDYESGHNPLGNIIKTSMAIAPLGLGSYAAYTHIKSNKAVNAALPFGIGAGGSGALPEAGKALGAELRTSMKRSRSDDLVAIKNLTDKLMKEDTLKKYMTSIGEQQALVQSLLTTLDDPDSGFAPSSVLSYKQKLIDLSRETGDPEELRKVIGTVVKAVSEQSNEGAQMRWFRNLREYRKIGPQLTSPGKPQYASSNVQTLLASNLSGQAKKNYERVVKKLAGGVSGRVTVHSFDWGGRKQFWAKVHSGRAGRSSYQFSMPLDIGAGNSAVLPFLSNEGLSTAYSSPHEFIDANVAFSMVKNGKAPGWDDVKKHASISPEDFYFNDAVSRARNGDIGRVSAREIRERQSFYQEVLPRPFYSLNDPAMVAHLDKVYGSGSGQVVSFVNFTGGAAANPEELMSQFATAEGFDASAPGYQAVVQDMDGGYWGRLRTRRRQNSSAPIDSLKTIGPSDRSYFPVESRIEQVYGRSSEFVVDKERRMGKKGVFHSGGTTTTSGTRRRVAQNIEWADNLTGATNKAVILDVKNDVYNAIEGEGVALGAGVDYVDSVFSKPVLDPGDKNILSSKLLEDLMSSTKPGEYKRYTREELAQYGGYLGLGPDKPQYLRSDPRMKHMELAYNVTEVSGRRQINIMGRERRAMDTWKGFSTMFKGTVQKISKREWYKKMHGFGFSSKWLGANQIGSHNAIISSGDPLKKGAGFFDLQLKTGYGLVSGDANYDSTLGNLYAKGPHSILPDTRLGRATGSVIDAMSHRVLSGEMSVEDMGRVLAPMYVRGHGGKAKIGGKVYKSFLQGADATQAVSSKALMKAIKAKLGGKISKEQYKTLVQTMASGVGVAATSLTQGTGVGDFGIGRGSVEPRFVYMLNQRLRNMGLSTEQIGQIMGSVYKHKLGGANAIKSASGLMDMVGSLLGDRGVLDGVSEASRNIPTYALGDLPKIASQDIGEFIGKHENGFILDLTSGVDSQAKAAIANNAKDVFKQGQIYIPGKEVADTMRETIIKNANKQDTVIHGKYLQMFKGLVEDLNAQTSQTSDAAVKSLNSMQLFKKTAIDMASATVHSLTRGKIKGMAFTHASMYSLDDTATFSSASDHQLVVDIFKKTKGQAIFFDSPAFLSQLNDFMGTNPGDKDLHYTARELENFYLGMDKAKRTGNAHYAKGNLRILTRHPELSMGNVPIGQAFRHVGDTDEYFQAFLETDHASQWAGKVKSWKDVSRMKANERHAFFYSMGQSLDDIAPQGGGIIYMPKTRATARLASGASYGGVDLGMAGAAIGDFDGDSWASMMFDREGGKMMMSALKNQNTDAWLKADAAYKTKSHIYAEEAKKSLKLLSNMNEQDIDWWGSESKVQQGVLKEQAAKASVGGLDTRLNRLRMAVLDRRFKTRQELDMVDEAMAVLKIVQEHTVIKGKKLPVYMPFAEALSGAIDRAVDTGDFGAVQDVFQNMIFKNSHLWGGDTITGMDNVLAAGSNATGSEINLSNVMKFLKDSLDIGRNSGIMDMPTDNWMALKLNSDNADEARKAYEFLAASGTTQTALMAEASGNTVRNITAGASVMIDKISSNLGHINAKMMGIGVAALGASIGIGAMIGHQGYGSRPLEMPGEVTDPDIRHRIAGGSLFSGISPGQLTTPSSPYNAMGPMGAPTTYVTPPNAYQLRGTIPGIRNVGNVRDYLGSYSSARSSGSIRINDTRLPITQNYMDRLVGE